MDKENKTTVAVLFGGRGVEHEISIITAQQIIAALDRDKYQIVPVYISKEGQWYGGPHLDTVAAFTDLERLLRQAQPAALDINFNSAMLSNAKGNWSQHIDVAIPAGHGAWLEDGCIQGLLEMAGIAYAGPGPLAAALGMDKIAQKAILHEAGLPALDYYAFTAAEWQRDSHLVTAQIEQELSFAYPLIVKPANLGSSIAVSRVADREQLIAAVEQALHFSRRIMVEAALEPCRELNIALFGDEQDLTFSVCEEVQRSGDMLSFADKYGGNGKGAGHSIPAELDKATEQQIQRYAAAAFRAMDGRGLWRADFLLSEKNKLYINELNTIPGSLAFYLFRPLGLSLSDLLERLIELAVQAQQRDSRLQRVFDNNILSSGHGKGEG